VGPPYLLALRQGGLRDDLFELAAARGVPGWFDPPVCVFHELPAWLGASELRPLGDFERAALLGSIMRAGAGPTFRGRESAFLGAVEQLFGELRAEAVTPDAYAAAVASLGEREQFENDRDAELVRLYGAYVGELECLGRRDGRDALADTATAVHASPARLAERLGGRREIRIVGVADLRGGWRALLSALSQSPALDRIVLYLTGDLPVSPELVASTGHLPGTPLAADLLAPASERAGRVALIREPDVDRELEAVSSKVRALIDAGTPPHRIAVVSRDARPYGDFAIRALAAAGVPATARRRIAYHEIPAVRAVLTLLEAGAEAWPRHRLAELGAQPYFAGDVDTRVVNFIGYRERVAGLDSWTAALDRLLAEARAAEAAPADETERRARTLPAQWVERAAERFQLFTAMAAAIDGERPIAGWLEWLADWLERDPWRMQERIMRVPAERWDLVRLDLLGWRGLRAVVADWLAAERQWPGPEGVLNTGEFVLRLRTMLAGDVAVWTEMSRGVQVVEALAASHRAFDHVFLVGMNAGRFPRRAPSSLLLGERDREALHAAGLPLDTTSDWDARERGLFRALVAGATESLTLSYVRLDEAGADAIPSSFVYALQDAGRAEPAEWRPVPLYRSPAIAAHAFRVAAIERERATGRLSPWNGSIEDAGLRAWLAEAFGDSRLWSPTQIESYAKCPWSYFSERLLRLELHQDPDGDIDPRARGGVLHDALRRFYEAAARRAGGPVFVETADAGWARPLLLESLAEALSGAEANVWLGHPALRDLKHAELEQLLLAFLDFEIEENRKAFDGRTTAGRTVRTAVAEHEVTFDGISLERDGITFRFRGTMDRVEVGADDRAPGSWVAAVDYKTTIYSCPGAGQPSAWDDGVVLQVPLYAWALSVLRPGAAVARVEYRAIKQARRAHCLSLVRVGRGGVTDGAEERARMDGALSAVARHVSRIRAGEFPATPASSCNCPPFCHAWDVCRVRGGPSTGRD
jgi:ATP-dependent helicase/nuclease subunit B